MNQVWLKSLDIYSSYRLETKIWARLGQKNPSKFDEICPLAIQNQIFTISMHIPSLVSSIDIYSSYHPKRNTDGQTDGRTDARTIIPRHYRVVGYKNGIQTLQGNPSLVEFKTIITRCKRIGYRMDIMRQTACIVSNQIIMYSYDFLFNSTTVRRA